LRRLHKRSRLRKSVHAFFLTDAVNELWVYDIDRGELLFTSTFITNLFDRELRKEGRRSVAGGSRL
jgi:hypothetical protein